MTLVVIIGLLAYIAYKIYDFPFAVVNIAKTLSEQNPEPTDEDYLFSRFLRMGDLVTVCL